jgi:deoxyribodipyrimidine photolyase-like uncharacterized protein
MAQDVVPIKPAQAQNMGFPTYTNDKRLAAALLPNLGLLSPREVCAAAEAVWRAGRAPLNAVEGFVGQILG